MIENFDRFTDSLWNWDILASCWGKSRIKPTDLDGLIERHGFKLVLEAKGPRAEVKQGQQILFDSLRDDGWTILVIWGRQDKPGAVQVWGLSDKLPANLVDVQALCSAWYEAANGRRRPDLSELVRQLEAREMERQGRVQRRTQPLHIGGSA